MSHALWSQLSWQEKESLEQMCDGPIADQAVKDLLGSRQSRTQATLITQCKAQLAVVQEMAAEIEHFRAKGQDRLVDIWQQKIAYARATLDLLDDELQGMQS